MTENAKKYLEKGAPAEIMHGEYKGVLVDVSRLNDGYVIGLYSFPGGKCDDGSLMKL